MTSERADAYGRVMKALGDLGPAKLHPGEDDLIRDAADTLFFSEVPAADGVEDARAAVRDLLARMVESDRLFPETAERMLADLDDCGPALAATAG